MIRAIKNLLAHPETRDLAVDDPEITARRRNIIQSNAFLRRIYEEWYGMIAASIPDGPGRAVEVGSGAGFLARYISGLIASEVFPSPNIDVVLDARRLPFPAGSLKAIAMVDVLHHVPNTRAFLSEARRCLRPGGCIAMIEPWVSAWSRPIYKYLHHEPFAPDAPSWEFPEAGPLSGANGALPWIVFQRDRGRFEAEFPEFAIECVRPFMPFRYLLSGGVSMRPLMPAWTFNAWRTLESLVAPARPAGGPCSRSSASAGERRPGAVIAPEAKPAFRV